MQIQLIDNDLDFSDGRGIVLISGSDEVVQRINTRLKLFKGEWFLNKEAGIPYLLDIFGKPTDNQIVAAFIRYEIINTPGVTSIDNFSYLLNNTTRVFSVSFHARIMSDDELINIDFNTDIPLGVTR